MIEATFADELDERQSRLRHRTALSTVLDDGLSRMIRDADERLTWVRGSAARGRRRADRRLRHPARKDIARSSNDRSASRR